VPVLGGPVVAILLGLIVGQFAGQRESWKAGTTFAGKKVLQASIVLLGATMSLGQVGSTGGRTLPVLLGTLTVALVGGWLLTRLLKVEQITGQLVTYGTGICGASAIATMSAVIGAPATSIALSVTVIVVYNVLGALFFPILGHMMGLSQEAFGLWAGTAVNDTSSVLAAATVYGATAAGVAVVGKLTRTLAIVPLAPVRVVADAPEGGRRYPARLVEAHPDLPRPVPGRRRRAFRGRRAGILGSGDQGGRLRRYDRGHGCRRDGFLVTPHQAGRVAARRARRDVVGPGGGILPSPSVGVRHALGVRNCTGPLRTHSSRGVSSCRATPH